MERLTGLGSGPALCTLTVNPSRLQAPESHDLHNGLPGFADLISASVAQGVCLDASLTGEGASGARANSVFGPRPSLAESFSLPPPDTACQA